MKEPKQLPEQHCKSLCRPAPTQPAQAFQTRLLSLPTHRSQQKGQPQCSAATGSRAVLSFAVAWNYIHRYPFLLGDGDLWGTQEHQQSQLCLPTFPCISCTKRNKQVKEAKQYFIDSQKTDMDCIQPWKTSYFLKSQNYKQENSFLINNLTPFLCQKVLARNIFPLQFNFFCSFEQLKKLCL